jgi:nuclear pore complex protein Nup214
LREFRVSPDNSPSIQLCWNPVISSTLAVCTASGGLNLYSLKDTGVEFHSIDPNLKAKCCCWSPKGKQIVAGFANGKLMQFNLELKSARVIECPPGVFATGGNFETIAVQWLSTYQFAMALSSQQEETRPGINFLSVYLFNSRHF